MLRHAANEGSGAIGEALQARGIRQRLVGIDRGEPVPRDLDGASGLLVMGGPMGVYEADRYTHLRDEMKLIERAIARGIPVLGVCLGSQLVAATLGATVTRGARPEIGWREVRLCDEAAADPILAGLPSSLVPLHWHGDVFELPAGAVRLASSEQTPHQAFRSGADTWGLLFHLEMRLAEVRAMVQVFEGDLPRVGLRPADVLDAAPERTEALAPLAARVFGAWADRLLRRPPA